MKHPESSNRFLANRWRNHSSVKRLGVVLSEVKMCFKIWFWRFMRFFALSLSILSMSGGAKISYSSNLYTCEHFLWSNPYLLRNRGVCFWVSRSILKMRVLWFVSLIFKYLYILRLPRWSLCLGTRESGKRMVGREEKQFLYFQIIGLKKINKPSWGQVFKKPMDLNS